ncbi:MAG: 50S ribosomal protein L35 [bacterium]
MPKMKTHSSSKKRFKKTSTGKIKRTKAYRRHHGWAKSSKKTRKLRSESYVDDSNKSNISRLLPYQ